jgi:hypothetical protein
MGCFSQTCMHRCGLMNDIPVHRERLNCGLLSGGPLKHSAVTLCTDGWLCDWLKL